jgi:hypothetical protein
MDNKVAPRNNIPGIAESNREPIPAVNLIPGNCFWGLAEALQYQQI